MNLMKEFHAVMLVHAVMNLSSWRLTESRRGVELRLARLMLFVGTLSDMLTFINKKKSEKSRHKLPTAWKGCGVEQYAQSDTLEGRRQRMPCIRRKGKQTVLPIRVKLHTAGARPEAGEEGDSTIAGVDAQQALLPSRESMWYVRMPRMLVSI